MTAQTALDAVTALAWVVVVATFTSLVQHSGDAAQRFYWLTLLGIALALTALVPPVYRTVDRWSGIPNVAHLVSNGCALMSAWAAQALLFHLTYPAKQAVVRTRVVGLVSGVALLLMAVSFASAPLHDEALDFTGRFRGAPYIFEYRLVFLSALGLGMANAALLFWRYARWAAPPTLRLGLRLCASASGIGLVYVGNEAVRVGVARLHVPDPLPNPGLFSEVLLATFITVGLVGATVAGWGARLGIDAAVCWLGQYRSLQRLYPLWAALYRINPDIALNPPPSRLADCLSWRRVAFRLYRRTIEIRDGWLLLRPSMDPRVLSYVRAMVAAAALPEPEARAVADAAVLAVALGRRPHQRQSLTRVTLLAQSEGEDLPDEVAALERVARCYQHSPIVRAVVARFSTDQTTPARALQGER